jgi:hypothetical protein
MSLEEGYMFKWKEYTIIKSNVDDLLDVEKLRYCFGLQFVLHEWISKNHFKDKWITSYDEYLNELEKTS